MYFSLIRAVFLIIIVVGNIGDVAFTHYAISRGIPEANPFILFMLNQWGMAAVSAYKGTLISLLFISSAYYKRVWFTFALGGVAVVYSLVLVYHVYFLV